MLSLDFADTAIINTVLIAGGAANTCDRYESTTINLTKDVNNATVHTQTISRCADYASPDSLLIISLSVP